MATKHRKRGQAAKRFATMGAATATAAVVVRYFSFVGYSYGFETSVWVHTYSLGFMAGRKIKRRIVVHHNKWIHALHTQML